MHAWAWFSMVDKDAAPAVKSFIFLFGSPQNFKGTHDDLSAADGLVLGTYLVSHLYRLYLPLLLFYSLHDGCCRYVPLCVGESHSHDGFHVGSGGDGMDWREMQR